MKLKLNDHDIQFIPEDNFDWYDMGQISKNINCNIKKDRSHLDERVSEINIKISDILQMLKEGKIIEKDEL